MLPLVVSASKSGAVSPICKPISCLLFPGPIWNTTLAAAMPRRLAGRRARPVRTLVTGQSRPWGRDGSGRDAGGNLGRGVCADVRRPAGWLLDVANKRWVRYDGITVAFVD